ncbi:MAG TPA: type VI secretion system baseplate subunit TssE [Bryobacteraceae bacterium]|jgi:type VI secretion system protein ImpF|nr:type VI secretion system baseplate subunit TssE [Bryobacteraceae bacterium]
MPRWEPEQTVTLSFLDRLIDNEPKQASDPPPSRARSIRQLKASLRRDLEWLLNTRRRPDPAGPEFKELEKSLFNFGLEDVTSMSWAVHKDRMSLTKMIEQCVAIFEPRISRIKVVSLEATEGAKHILRFQIEGLLDMDPAPELITFDTVLQLSSGEYQVGGEPSA